MTRALIVCYSFPPVGGAGVQRAVKLVKYLPEHGVTPRVLTVKNPSVPVYDHTLEKDVPPDLEVIRATTLEPGYGAKQAAWKAEASQATPSLRQRALHGAVSLAKHLLVPDAQVLWQPGAQLALARQLRRGEDDVVFITAPPFSEFLLAPLVRALGRPVVLDYRDEWNVARSSFEMLAGGLSASATDKLEEALVRTASAITVATPAYRDELIRRFPFLDPERVFAISNGYDPDDLPPELPRPPTDKLVLTWAGTIYRLTRAHGLLEAVKRVHEREPELAKKLELRFYGRIVDTEAPAFEGMEALGVKRLGYVPHDEVLARVAEGHWAMVLVADTEGMERMYPGKVFELMMLDRPLLTLAPEGVLTELVRRHGLGTVFPPDDVSAIADFLIGELRAFEAEPEALRPLDRDTTGIEQYHRKALAGRFAEVFRAVTA